MIDFYKLSENILDLYLVKNNHFSQRLKKFNRQKILTGCEQYCKAYYYKNYKEISDEKKLERLLFYPIDSFLRNYCPKPISKLGISSRVGPGIEWPKYRSIDAEWDN